MTNQDSKYQSIFALGTMFGMFSILGAMCYSTYDSNKTLKQTRNIPVQEGFIHPNRLEIQLKDLDKNGLPETILKVDKEFYLLREIKGKPVLSLYHIEPAKIIPENSNSGYSEK